MHSDCYLQVFGLFLKGKTLMKKIFLIVACFGLMKMQAQNAQVSIQDKEFTESALRANMMKVKFSELAVNKAFSPAVKELAQNMLNDHKKADDLLRQLAESKAITMPTQLDEDDEKEFKKLSDKEGEDFDKFYTDHTASEQNKIINLYEKQTKKGENTELRAFATNTLPSINHHKNITDQTCKKLKKKG